ncbi:MAG: Asp-tRNA(Asn)/Glu-tRNA(Gln) amidotransferase subunit GatA, partial [Firmicutes bacterium]|nr:Asp-tRNA(Asn)/Glu-tRNA(Gln) amidotransferase subunit GatA [Bacillota bacterium]
MEIFEMTAATLSGKIRDKEISVTEAVDSILGRIQEKDKEYNCYITVCDEKARADAKQIQDKISSGELTGPLAGVPVAVKDNMCTEGVLTSCASRILSNFVPVYSSDAVLRLQAAGAIVIGKTNMDEFAMGSTTETSWYGPTKNPADPTKVPGGSSGGSAAAVAADECICALGSDTGGYIRQPASYCGVVGMKPTYGTVSRYGLIAYGSSLDQIGPITKDVTDCANLLQVISGHDPKDSTSLKRDDLDFSSALTQDVKGLKIGIPRTYFGAGLDEDVKEKVL